MPNSDLPYFRQESSCYAIRRGKEPGGPIKLGYTHQMHTRYKNLQNKIPEMLTFLMVIPGTFRLEKLIHKAFDRIRVSPDCEWFLDPERARQVALDEMFREMHRNDDFCREIMEKIAAGTWSY